MIPKLRVLGISPEMPLFLSVYIKMGAKTLFSPPRIPGRRPFIDYSPNIQKLLPMKAFTQLLLFGLAAIALSLIWVRPVSAGGPLAAIPGAAQLFAGQAPSYLGVHQEQLSPCPVTPNCVASQAQDPGHFIEPLTYQSKPQRAQELLVQVLGVVPRTHIVEAEAGYIHAEAQSRLLGFVDDLEFYFPPNDHKIQVRSAARLGESDLGVNRRRLEQIRLALQDLGV
jgi:uncharacterized protein (DUF1499 family)